MSSQADVPISVYRNDPDRWLGFQICRGMDVNIWSSGLVAIGASSLSLVLLYFSPESYFRSMVLERGPTQYAAVIFGAWAAVTLLMKRRKLRIQRMALQYSIVPNDHSFVLSSQTADQVSSRIHEIAEDPERFIVFNRILIAISSLKNLGRVSDADEILNSIADQDSSAHETSFSILNGFVWAIPVLGFIGTVLGLSVSIASFSTLLESQMEMEGIVHALREVTGGLSVAFETTLLALVIALVLQLWMTGQKKAEEEFLDDCHDYCLRYVTSKIKILPYEQAREV